MLLLDFGLEIREEVSPSDAGQNIRFVDVGVVGLCIEAMVPENCPQQWRSREGLRHPS
jgi:hypothetical protein